MVGLTRQGLVKQPIVAEIGNPGKVRSGVSFAGRAQDAKYRMGPRVKVHCDRL